MKRLQRTHLQARSRCRSWCISTEIFFSTGLHSCWSDFVSQPIGNDAMNRQQAPRKSGADQRALMTFRSTCSYYQCILTNHGSEHTRPGMDVVSKQSGQRLAALQIQDSATFCDFTLILGTFQASARNKSRT